MSHRKRVRSIGVSVGGSLNGMLRVNAFVTGRNNPSDWPRYSLVVLNWYVMHFFHQRVVLSMTFFHLFRDDNASSSWNPQNVAATIEFRGMQVGSSLLCTMSPSNPTLGRRSTRSL